MVKKLLRAVHCLFCKAKPDRLRSSRGYINSIKLLFPEIANNIDDFPYLSSNSKLSAKKMD